MTCHLTKEQREILPRPFWKATGPLCYLIVTKRAWMHEGEIYHAFRGSFRSEPDGPHVLPREDDITFDDLNYRELALDLGVQVVERY